MGRPLTLLIIFLLIVSISFTGLPASAQIATRSMPSTIEPSEIFEVRIDVSGYGAFGQVVEMLPSDFSFMGSSLQSYQVDVEGQTVKFTLLGERSFTYKVRAAGEEGTYTFKGVLKDEYKKEYPIGGDSQIIVTPPPDITAPSVRVISPNGGEVWKVGEIRTIAWEAADNVGVARINIYYSTNGGAAWKLIAQAVSNSGDYRWEVPSILSENCLVKVEAFDTAGNKGSDVSDRPFTIVDISPPKPVIVSIEPSSTSTRRGQSFTISIYVDVTGYGISGGEVVLSFNANVMKVVEVKPGTLFGADTIQGIKEIDNEAGTLTYALARIGEIPVPTPSGDFAIIEFEVSSNAERGNYEIKILKVGLADENFQDILGIETRGGTVAITGLLGDINGDGKVNYIDLAMLGASYGKRGGTPGFNPAADLNGDGIIDYKDLAILGADYGKQE